jgi:uncharacterized protein (TIGR00730 family)
VRPSYKALAQRMGSIVARKGLKLVYGGGRVGLMGALADTALKKGGEVIGVIPEALVVKEIAHESLSTLHVVGSMHERKKLMADLSDGFVALPGGYGTLEEFVEVLSWAQLRFHEKPCGLLDVDGYWKPLSLLFDKAVVEGFVRREHRSLVLMEEDPELLLDKMNRYVPLKAKRWIGSQDL